MISEDEDKVCQEAIKQICTVGKYRREIIDRMKQALLADDHEKVVKYAKQLCGVDDESNRISEGLDPGTRQWR